MAETSSLLNCRTGSRTGGSNPPPSAGAHFQQNAARSIHLMVRIQDSQSWHRGSIPLSTTKKCVRTLAHFFFCHSLRPSNARRFNSKAHGNRSRVRYLLKCLPHFVPMPPLLRSNAYSYIVQGISTPRSRHPDKRQRASQQTAAGIPTNGSMYSRRTVAGIPAPHTEPGRHVARCSVAVHNEALFILYLYLYLYIY